MQFSIVRYHKGTRNRDKAIECYLTGDVCCHCYRSGKRLASCSEARSGCCICESRRCDSAAVR